MCGIVGYVGGREACPILLKGLHRLEYRGYDSAGVAMIDEDGALNVYKCKGKVSDLEHFLAGKELGGNIGIAHTRWATHGVPNDVNAHPHCSESENIALIHNGIIENYRVLKDALEENGYTFRSSTDSEVLVNLIEYIRSTNACSLLEAVQQALRQVVGAYAIAVVEKNNRDEIIAARQSSPMAIGIGRGEYFLSSDAASIIEYTQDFVYVNDGEIAVINRNKPLKIVTLDNHEGRIDIKKLQMSISQLEKGGYPHFMLKEIYEQPKTIVDCIRGRINPETGEVKLSGVIDNRRKFLQARRIIFVACGTSWHAALIGEHLIENICRIPVEVEYASEFRYRNPVIYEDDIVIAVSQSGETADTLAAVELARIDLDNTRVTAPRDGQLGQIGTRLGAYVNSGAQLMALVPDTLWVIANMKETQMADVRIGQPVRFTVDALNHLKLYGHVQQISPATGSEFALLQADNATGNFVKIAQRIPVRIEVLGNAEEAARLRPGMSVQVTIDTREAE